MDRKVIVALLCISVLLLIIAVQSADYDFDTAEDDTSFAMPEPLVKGKMMSRGPASSQSNNNNNIDNSNSRKVDEKDKTVYPHDVTDKHIRELIRAIHKQQHPPKRSCKSRRLLVTQFSAKSFEGIGSILKIVMMGMAEAAYSNRTLIWGLDLPFMFEHTRDVWHANGDEDMMDGIKLKDYDIDCSGWIGQGGGPYTCFFEPVSSCSLDDLTEKELVELGKNGYSDEGRVRIMEARRGVSMYMPPYDLPEFKQVFDQKITFPRHKWAAALGAYSYRLKPSLYKQLERRRLDLWPESIGGTGRSGALRCNSNCDAKEGSGEASGEKIVWGLHVRHGDVLSLKDVYGNRKPFEFKEYFSIALDRAKQYSVLPDAVYVTSDNPDTTDFVEAQCQDAALKRWTKGAVAGSAPPCIFTVDATLRYRTEHGSHTIAAEGGCTLGQCALYQHQIIEAKKLNADSDVPKAVRLMQVLLEAIEDSFMLSRTDNIVTQGTSHFSSLAILVSWARTGADPSSVFFIDAELIESGLMQGSFLHGSLNGTSSIDPKRAFERWVGYTHRFIEGIQYDNLEHYKESGNGIYPLLPLGRDSIYRFHVKDLLPFVPHNVWEAERPRMLGLVRANSTVWSGECPLSQIPEQSVDQYVVDLINHGADHSNDHPNQAMRCWILAEQLMEKKRAKMGSRKFSEENGALEEVLTENMAALRSQQMFPYSMGVEQVRKLMALNVVGGMMQRQSIAAVSGGSDKRKKKLKSIEL